MCEFFFPHAEISGGRLFERRGRLAELLRWTHAPLGELRLRDVQPTHDTPPCSANQGEENIRLMQAVPRAEKASTWESRPLDITSVLDGLPSRNRVPGLSGKIDADRIGVGGHSMGSYATEAVAERP